MDMDALHTLLSLREKLVGHPDLGSLKALVDHELTQIQASAKEEVGKLAIAREAETRKVTEAKQAEMQRQQAAAAKERLDKIEAEKQQLARDAELVAKAPKISDPKPAAIPSSTFADSHQSELDLDKGSTVHFATRSTVDDLPGPAEPVTRRL